MQEALAWGEGWQLYAKRLEWENGCLRGDLKREQEHAILYLDLAQKLLARCIEEQPAREEI